MTRSGGLSLVVTITVPSVLRGGGRGVLNSQLK